MMMAMNTLLSPIRFVVVLILFALLAAPPSPAAVVDQSTGLAPNGGDGFAIVSVQDVAQSVTVGIPGPLTRVDLQLFRNTGALNDVTLQIVPMSGGLPDDANPYYTTVIPLSEIPVWDDDSPSTQPWTGVDVSTAALEFERGEQFAITLTGAGLQPWVSTRDASGLYDGGDAFTTCCGTSSPWQTFGDDLRFQTWVAPEPGSSTLGVSSALSLALLARSTRRRRPGWSAKASEAPADQP